MTDVFLFKGKAYRKIGPYPTRGFILNKSRERIVRSPEHDPDGDDIKEGDRVWAIDDGSSGTSR